LPAAQLFAEWHGQHTLVRNRPATTPVVERIDMSDRVRSRASRWRGASVALLAVALMVGLVSSHPEVVHAAGTAKPLVKKDLAYAPRDPAGGNGHLLDLYVPRGTGRPVPLVMWSRGSAWHSDDARAGAEIVAARLNPRGYAVAGVSVRSSTTVTFPGQIYDIKAAVRYLRANATRYNLDPDRFAVMGESSGGWVAAMAAVTGGVSALEGRLGVTKGSSRVQAAISIYPPTDFLRMDAQLGRRCRPVQHSFKVGDCHTDVGSPESVLLGCQVTSCRPAAGKANPITYVDKRDPPLLLLAGKEDRLVPWQQSAQLYRAARSACADATLVLMPHGGHGIWARYLTERRFQADATVESSRRCASAPARPVTVGWAYLADFLDRAFTAASTA
jgi:acetyl esterase/lipase